MPPFLEVLSAAAPIVGPLIGGLLGTTQQSSANRTNLQATRETNAMNERLFNQQLQQQQSQFEEQLSYLSPSRQRAMLEQAGYSPYSYLNGGSSPSAGTPHTGATQQMQAAHVEPVTAFADSLQQVSANIRNIAEAKKLDSERKGQDLQNDTYMTQLEKTLEMMGYQNKIAEVKAHYAGQEEEQLYQQLINANLLAKEDIERIQIANKIQKEYNEKIQPQELNKLVAEIDKLKASTETEKHLQSYYDAAAKAGLSNAAANNLRAWIDKQKMPYEIESLRQENERMRQENAVYREFGAKQAQAILDGYNTGAWKNEQEARQYLRKNAGLSDSEIGKLQDIAPWLFGAMIMKGTPNPIRGFGR